MQLCNFYRHVQAEFGQSVHDVNSLLLTEDNSTASHGKNMKLGAHPNY